MRLFHKSLLGFCLALLGWTGFASPPAFAEDGVEDGASVIMYHRFGEGEFPATSVTLGQIDAHIEELKSGDYTVLALPEIVRRLKSGEDFPENSVAITIDDAYLSVYKEAWPRFKKAGFPFTIFVATDPIDREYSKYMTWDQIRDIAEDPLVTIGSQTASHLHMINHDAERNAAEFTKSNARFTQHLGYSPDLLAYPYGEYDASVIIAAKKAGFVAAFGQHSGAFGSLDSLYSLPRFAMNENYGTVARLKTAARALPIPARDFGPVDTIVTPANNPPLIGFTLPENFPRIEALSCFSNHEGRLKVEHLGPRVEVRMSQKLNKGRTRLNCTMPTGAKGDGRFLWLGRLYYVK